MAPSDADSSLVGKLIDDRYEILEVLGEGGVGVVYRAHRVQLERVVAIKVLQESLVEDAGFVARFQREAVAMSRLYHPHCVAVIDFGVYESRPYLVLEYLPGQTVKALLEQGPFSAQRAVHIILQLLETLEYFHSHHVIHRDLKSENVMLVESSGTSDFVKVLDFGMAKILTGPGADSQLSKIGIVPGTPSAMAPEQIQQLPPDPRIDIYATGILLYEMIVGHRPFTGSDMATVVKMQISEPAKPPRQLVGDSALSAELEQVIMKALEKDRLDRFATAADMAAAVRLTSEARAPASRASEATQQAGRRSRRARRVLGVGLAAALTLGTAAAVALWHEKPWREPVAASVPHVAPPVAAMPRPSSAPPPPPKHVVEPWLAHRDLAVTYSGKGLRDEAFREVQAAVADNPAAVARDSALVSAAVFALTRDRVPFLIEVFRSNPLLVEALVDATLSNDSERRNAAYEALRALEQESRADQVAMWMLDLEQATRCATMRAAFRKLQKSGDPRVRKLVSELRGRGREDRHARCLSPLLQRR